MWCTSWKGLTVERKTTMRYGSPWDYLTPFQLCYEVARPRQTPFIEPGMYVDAGIEVTEYPPIPFAMMDLTDFWAMNQELEGRN
jgi:hypothetical protein